ncbi:MAG: hypothetical protein K0R00_4108 [Herbinix sp.]|jgi:hypothetical protein|nr:hypothetical protein [Herbinix sp.]
MKPKFKKRFVLLLILLLLFTYNIVSAHTHVHTKKSSGVSYIDKGTNYHDLNTYDNYSCPCGDSYTVLTSYITLSHEYPSYSYSGYNYHSGTKHVFEFARYCTYCSHRDSYTTTRSCSGPPCIIPY